MKATAAALVHSLCEKGVQAAGKRLFKGSPVLTGFAESYDFSGIVAFSANTTACGKI